MASIPLVNLILKKISKIGATRCQILRLTCTKIDFGMRLRPRPSWGAYSAPQTPYLYLKGPTSKGKEGGGEERMESEGKGGERRTTLHTPCRKFLATPLHFCVLTNLPFNGARHFSPAVTGHQPCGPLATARRISAMASQGILISS